MTLGEGRPVEGTPLARVAARLTWGIERSAVLEREGDTVIRTRDGPREFADVLAAVEEPYFATQQEFERAVRAVIGTGPIPTADTEPVSDESDSDNDTTGDGK